MAEILKREFNVIALKTEVLDTPVNGDDVRFTLQFHLDAELHDDHQWYTSTAVMGLSQKTGTGSGADAEPALTLPAELLHDLHHWFSIETDDDRPLWVHLVKPYGILRFVPWERLLGQALQRPILMLPDFIFPPPHELTTVLDVVVCCSAPLKSEHGSAYNALCQAIERILSIQRQQIRIHVFADHEFTNALRTQWSGDRQADSGVFIYDNAMAAAYVGEDPASRLGDQSGALRSPWLLWMRDALKGRSIDIVHFICHGYLTRQRGALLFAQSPLERTERYLAGPVGACELQTFMTQVGAWSTVFTSLPDNHSEPGLRALADDIAQSRPGPMMMHVMREDLPSQALGAGYQFLFANEAQHPPRSTALFIYCQPYLSIDALSFGGQRSVAGSGRYARPENNAGYDSFKTNISRNARQYGAIFYSEEPSPLDQLFDDAHYASQAAGSGNLVSVAPPALDGLGSMPSPSQQISPAYQTFSTNDKNVTGLVASTERFSEQVQLRYQQLARDDVLPTAQFDQQMLVSLDTVDKIRQAVADHCDETPGATEAGL